MTIKPVQIETTSTDSQEHQKEETGELGDSVETAPGGGTSGV